MLYRELLGVGMMLSFFDMVNLLVLKKRQIYEMLNHTSNCLSASEEFIDRRG